MFKKTLLARALTLAFGTAALGFAVTNPVMAQSSAAGTIIGKIESAAGSSINVTNLETGLQRKASAGADGRFQITALPPGRYKVELSRNGAVASSQEVEVLAGQNAEPVFSQPPPKWYALPLHAARSM